MNIRNTRNLLVTSLGVLALVPSCPVIAAETDAVSWCLFERCTSPPDVGDETAVVSCGTLGVYYLGHGKVDYGGTCKFDNSGIEIPPRYGTPTPLQSEWQPCAEGSCFVPPGQPAGQPAVAVIDWNNEHGWSVGEIIELASDDRVDLRLFPLDALQIGKATPQAGISDAHVLASLCAVVEAVEQVDSGIVAVNMSFGRAVEALDESEILTIGDEIAMVLAHLRMLEIDLYAAAGNHGELLFPARAESVTPVGTLDTVGFPVMAGLTSAPSWHTPAGVRALFPGTGLFLVDADTELRWSAAPGSSYATAIAAGWISGYTILKGNQVPHNVEMWSTQQLDGLSVLAHDGAGLPDSSNPSLTNLFETIAGFHPWICQRPSETWLELAVSSELVALPEHSLPRHIANTHRPAPDTWPCVPCQGFIKEVNNRGGTSWDMSIFIDLSESGPIPQDYAITGVYLRVAESIYLIEASDTALQLINAGEAAGLVLNGPEEIIAFEQSMSLVYTVEDQAGGEFWHATPVNLHSHE